ncbi:T9SS type A sorting domain-containing protein [Flavobacteriales bacterium]|nr:T9SS type A sorting domain-containing protein [Flavobacteriales bacterium]
MKKIALVISLIVITLSSYSQQGRLDGTGYAPNFTVTDINGTSHTIYDYLDSGFVVVIELLSTTCGHCIQYAPHVESSYLTNGPSGSNVARFLGLEINANTDSTDIVNFQSAHGGSFPVADNVSPTGINYQLYYTPSFYVIYPDSSYTTMCPQYCVSTSSAGNIESLLDNAIAAWTPPVPGCMDSLALNYDSLANVDDGSCDYSSYTITTVGMTFSPDTIVCDVGDTINFILGGYHNAVEVSDSTWMNNGSTPLQGGFSYGYGSTGYYVPDDCHTFYYVCQPHVSMGMKGVIIAHHPPVFGCTDSLASNYDSLATVDDASCLFNGCTDTTALNYDSNANVDDGSCCYSLYGCTDPNTCNYNPCATMDDGSCIYSTPGCMDPLANNYNPLAGCDDGSCTYINCASPVPSGLSVNWTTDTKASVSWDNMNDNSCMVFKYFIRYRVDNLDGTYGNWVTKSAGVGNGLCNFGLNTTEKRLQFLTAATTYQFKMKAFYCGGTQSGYSSPATFTTGADCPPMTNLAVQTFNSNQAKATFSWDTTGSYVFARIALRVDTSGATWGTVGGFGIYYPTLTANKFGLTPGQSYRAQGRTFCDSNVTSFRSTWTSPLMWTQPGTLIRMESTSQIKNLDIYPNPSRDIFNIRFVSEKIQDLSIRVINIMGELVYEEKANQFIGEYTKQIDLTDNSKGVYFLEITTDNNVVNRKIIIQ